MVKNRMEAIVGLLKLTALAAGYGLLFVGLCAPALARDPVPEIDAGSMASALSLLTGGMLILSARRGQK